MTLSSTKRGSAGSVGSSGLCGTGPVGTVDDWSARSIDEKGGLLHQREAVSIHEVAGLGRQRTVHGNDVGVGEDVVETNEFGSERGSHVGIGKWIVGDESHVERLGEAE